MWKPQEALAAQTPGSWLGQWAFSGQSPTGPTPSKPTFTPHPTLAGFFVLNLHSNLFSSMKLKALLWKVLCPGGSWASTYFISGG